MKKKILLMFFCLVCLIGVTGCGKSKEFMIKNAKELNNEEINKDIMENKLNAQDKYEGNIYRITGLVTSIDGDSILMSDNFKVYLSNNDIKSIKNGQKIDIVGEISKILESKVEIKNAYIINDEYTISGTVKIPTRKHLVHFVDYTGAQSSRTYYQDYEDDEWYMEIGDYKITSSDKQNFLGEGETILLDKKIENNMIITVTGKIFGNEIREINSIKISK